jgi:hypothetical protein
MSTAFWVLIGLLALWSGARLVLDPWAARKSASLRATHGDGVWSSVLLGRIVGAALLAGGVLVLVDAVI